MGLYRNITIKRRVLLFEIERRCGFSDCNERNFTGLTKHEAFAYMGFECHVCKRWNEDSLTKKDVPDWWDEIQNQQVQAQP
jgi:hypothetical protein